MRPGAKSARLRLLPESKAATDSADNDCEECKASAAAHRARHYLSDLAVRLSGSGGAVPSSESFWGAAVFVDVVASVSIAQRLVGDAAALDPSASPAEAARRGADALSRALNACFAAVLAIARLNGGDCLQFLGDALLLMVYADGEQGVPAACSKALRIAADVQLAIEGDLAGAAGPACATSPPLRSAGAASSGAWQGHSTARLRVHIGASAGRFHALRLGEDDPAAAGGGGTPRASRSSSWGPPLPRPALPPARRRRRVLPRPLRGGVRGGEASALAGIAVRRQVEGYLVCGPEAEGDAPGAGPTSTRFSSFRLGELRPSRSLLDARSVLVRKVARALNAVSRSRRSSQVSVEPESRRSSLAGAGAPGRRGATRWTRASGAPRGREGTEPSPASCGHRGRGGGRLPGPPPALALLPSDVAASVWEGVPFLAEMRMATTLFMKIGAYADVPEGEPELPREALLRLNASVAAAAACVAGASGVLRSAFCDDKGFVCLATWGLLGSYSPENALRACGAALAMRSAFADDDLGPISLGLATGRVFCGEVGDDFRGDYQILGDACNLAARLMSKAEGAVFVDEATQEAVEGRFELRPLPALHVKGYKAGSRFYELVGPKGESAGGPAPSRFGSRHRQIADRRPPARPCTPPRTPLSAPRQAPLVAARGGGRRSGRARAAAAPLPDAEAPRPARARRPSSFEDMLRAALAVLERAAAGTPLYGRQVELARVCRFLAAARSGASGAVGSQGGAGVLFVEAEMGMGKSSLVSEALRLADVAGVPCVIVEQDPMSAWPLFAITDSVATLLDVERLVAECQPQAVVPAGLPPDPTSPADPLLTPRSYSGSPLPDERHPPFEIALLSFDGEAPPSSSLSPFSLPSPAYRRGSLGRSGQGPPPLANPQLFEAAVANFLRGVDPALAGEGTVGPLAGHLLEHVARRLHPHLFRRRTSSVDPGRPPPGPGLGSMLAPAAATPDGPAAGPSSGAGAGAERPASMRAEMLALTEVLQAILRRTGAVLVVDDLFALDGPSLQVLASLAAAPGTFALHGPRAAVLELPGFESPEATRGFVARLVEVEPSGVPLWLAEELAEKSRGNPFVLSEFVDFLTENDWVTVAKGRVTPNFKAWEEDGGEAGRGGGARSRLPIPLPDSFERLIMSRLDRLPPAPALVCKLCSALGQRFEYGAALHALDGITADIDVAFCLAELEKHGVLLVNKQGVGIFECKFVQSSVFSLLYSLLGSDDRASVHLRAALYFERTASARSAHASAKAAHHFLEAGEPDRALPHLDAAGPPRPAPPAPPAPRRAALTVGARGRQRWRRCGTGSWGRRRRWRGARWPSPSGAGRRTPRARSRRRAPSPPPPAAASPPTPSSASAAPPRPPTPPSAPSPPSPPLRPRRPSTAGTLLGLARALLRGPRPPPRPADPWGAEGAPGPVMEALMAEGLAEAAGPGQAQRARAAALTAALAAHRRCLGRAGDTASAVRAG
eukprot:tig00001206_g7517.t1